MSKRTSMETVLEHGAIVIFSRHGTVIAANDGFHRILGQFSDYVSGGQFDDFVYSEDGASLSIDDLPISERGPLHLKAKLKTGTGLVPMMITLIPMLLASGETGFTMVVQSPRVSDGYPGLSFFSDAFQQSCEGMYVTDLNSRVLYINSAFLRMHGYREHEILGKHQSFFHSPKDMFTLVSATRQVLQFGSFEGEVLHVTKSGETFPALLLSSLISDRSGNPEAVLHTVTNLSEFKAAQDKLISANDRLRERVNSLEELLRESTRKHQESKEEVKKCKSNLQKVEEALSMLIAGVQEQKAKIREKIVQDISSKLSPLINRLEIENLPDQVRELTLLLRHNIDNLKLAMSRDVAIDNGNLLTFRELRVCEMIGSGLSSKEIACILNISPHTVFLYRAKIRRKLGLSGNKGDLTSYLRSTTSEGEKK
ncbi:PAS domain S-box protein [Desulfomonile tiedjei]|uniref:PAS domain S-box n=1 Tax=Desulfomonile tiedjei (strain ATCC 49306 / DSM 6799 / DCB-1) TaxID=706587 RepID=I4CD28_DESTA|nr:PAS domain S-box protein [Desulfomonile tiedjei]AFM27469.1 PAS domain S-box [Desulfomonile tiedjei DSM 6799]